MCEWTESPLSISGTGYRSVAFFQRTDQYRRDPWRKLKRSRIRDVDELSNVDHVVTNASSSQFEVQC